MTQPFDPTGTPEPTHLVLVNTAGARSLWPVFLPVPAGWATEHGPASHEDCLRALTPAQPAPPG
ncbi:MbtH family protein [Streptomyces sp. NBC_00322]|uniref:MbtH family NRPS accessory protein n=1 Tax=Streptomyces sp. NBC_00322 TaxID=2975712 RepID=UPI002E2A205B|nr:MbtH family NRPS accessory protein [Streptomyces sp. NBC_00322]